MFWMPLVTITICLRKHKMTVYYGYKNLLKSQKKGREIGICIKHKISLKVYQNVVLKQLGEMQQKALTGADQEDQRNKSLHRIDTAIYS